MLIFVNKIFKQHRLGWEVRGVTFTVSGVADRPYHGMPAFQGEDKEGSVSPV